MISWSVLSRKASVYALILHRCTYGDSVFSPSCVESEFVIFFCLLHISQICGLVFLLLLFQIFIPLIVYMSYPTSLSLSPVIAARFALTLVSVYPSHPEVLGCIVRGLVISWGWACYFALIKVLLTQELDSPWTMQQIFTDLDFICLIAFV